MSSNHQAVPCFFLFQVFNANLQTVKRGTATTHFIVKLTWNIRYTAQAPSLHVPIAIIILFIILHLQVYQVRLAPTLHISQNKFNRFAVPPDEQGQPDLPVS
jgi:hypothetical protein